MVGRSHECDFPPDVTALPVATAPRFDVNGASREIDARVKSLLAESVVADALGVYRVFPEKLRELRPTHIVTQTQCAVCAVSLRDVEAAAAEAAGCAAEIVSLQPNSLADVWADFMRVASALGDTEAGVKLVAESQNRMAAVEAKTRAIARPPGVAGIEWADPLMAWGNWMPELTLMAGGRSLFGKAGAHSPRLAYEELAAGRSGRNRSQPLRIRHRARAARPRSARSPAGLAQLAGRPRRTGLSHRRQSFFQPPRSASGGIA